MTNPTPANSQELSILGTDPNGPRSLSIVRPLHRSHALAIATENVVEHISEDVGASRFPLGHADLADVGAKLQLMGDGVGGDGVREAF